MTIQSPTNSLTPLAIGAAIAAGSFGCGNASTFSATLVDPHLVSVTAETPSGSAKSELAEGGSARARIPHLANGAIVRAADGAITVVYDRPVDGPEAPLAANGVLSLPGCGVDHVLVLGDASAFRAKCVYSFRVQAHLTAPRVLTFATPWDNVVEVRQDRTIGRVGGWLLMVGGVAAAVLGYAFVRVDSASDLKTVASIGAPIAFASGIVMTWIGASAAFSSDREGVIYSRER